MAAGFSGDISFLSAEDGFLGGMSDIDMAPDGSLVAIILNNPDYGTSPHSAFAQRFLLNGSTVGAAIELDSGALLQSTSQGRISFHDDGAATVAWVALDINRVTWLRSTTLPGDGGAAPAYDVVDLYKYYALLEIEALAGGGAVYAWADPIYDASGTTLFGIQTRDANGGMLPGYTLIDEVSSSSASFLIKVAALSDGGFVSVWNGGYQIFNADGTARGGFSSIAAAGAMPDGVGASVLPLAVTALSDGGFAIAGSYDDGLATETGVFVLRYDAQGRAITESTATNTRPMFFNEVTLYLGEDGSGMPVLLYRDDFNPQRFSLAYVDQDGSLVDAGPADTGLGAGSTSAIYPIKMVNEPDGELGIVFSYDEDGAPDEGYYYATLAGAVLGGAGDDLLPDRDGAQRFFAGAGADTADYSGATGRVLADLAADVSGSAYARFFDEGAGAGDIYDSVEHLTGGAAADNLRGDSGGNILSGGGVSDRLYGRTGDDTLIGGMGADALYGNLGADVMTGGPDAGRRDRYIYFQAADSRPGEGSRDIITDFVSGEDRIELRRIDANSLLGHKQGFDFIGEAAFTGTAGELGYRHEVGNTIVQADLDGDGRADFEIELTGEMDLVADDFLI